MALVIDTMSNSLRGVALRLDLCARAIQRWILVKRACVYYATAASSGFAAAGIGCFGAAGIGRMTEDGWRNK